MDRPARLRSSLRGLLLVEATLATVVIAVGLVFISRGIAGSLKALSRIQELDRLLQLAESTFCEVEAHAQAVQPVSLGTGIFPQPSDRYGWTLSIDPVPATFSGVDPQAFRSVILTVSRSTTTTPSVRLQSVWPIEWIAE
jgi:hypothetical protein